LMPRRGLESSECVEYRKTIFPHKYPIPLGST
jgi:hypothetical protein